MSESCSVVSDSLQVHDLYSPWDSPGQNTGVASLSLLQGIFPTQGSNPGIPQCRQILYQLSHQESPRILEWVAYSFSSGSSQTQESNLCLLHCRQILYQLNYQGSPGNSIIVHKCFPIKTEFLLTSDTKFPSSPHVQHIT